MKAQRKDIIKAEDDRGQEEAKPYANNNSLC
jgi:hypothetical protein